MSLHLTPNYTKGWTRNPLGIIIHWTDGNFANSVSWLCSPESKASAHFVIAPDGTRAQLVNTKDRAWHAGVSETKFGKYCNNYTFGIELVGPPSAIGLKGWDQRQIDSCVKICLYLKQKYPSIIFITDHSTIAPGRKIDVKKNEQPQDLFPWQALIEAVGLPDIV